MNKKQFLGFIHQYGLMEYEGAEYVSNCVVCEGNNMDELIADYCKKSSIELDTLSVDEDGGYYDWGFPILFARILDSFSYKDSKDGIPQLIDFKSALKNPFLNEKKKKFLGWVEMHQHILDKDIERGADEEIIRIDRELVSRRFFGIYEGYNMSSLIKDFRDKNFKNLPKCEDCFTKQNRSGAYIINEEVEEEYVVFAPINDSVVYDEKGNKLPTIGEAVINPFV